MTTTIRYGNVQSSGAREKSRVAFSEPPRARLIQAPVYIMQHHTGAILGACLPMGDINIEGMLGFLGVYAVVESP